MPNALPRSDTRSRLIEAGRLIVLKKGFNGTKIRDVVKEADVAVGTFYLYFKNLKDFFSKATEKTVSGVREEIRMTRGIRDGTISENPVAHIRQSFEVFFDYIDKNRTIALFLLRERRSNTPFGKLIQKLFDDFVQDLKEDIEVAKRMGIVRDLPADIIARIIIELSVGVGEAYASDRTVNRDVLLDTMTDLVLHGMYHQRNDYVIQRS